MTVAVAAIAILFGLFGGVLGIYAQRSGSNQVPFGAPTPLIGKKLRANQQVWQETHRAGAPYLATAAAICLIQALALAAMLLYPDLMTLGYLGALTATGIILILLLLFLGGRPLNK